MPKLERFKEQIFANQAGTNSLAVFGSMVTGNPQYSKDVETLQGSEAFQAGFASAVKQDRAPYMAEFNALIYGLTYQMAYIFQQGVPDWDAGTTYYTNSYCQLNGVWYRSLIDENSGNNPTSEAGAQYWQLIDIANLSTDLANLKTSVDNLADIYAKIASPTFTGSPKAPTPANASNNTQIATTAFVKNVLSSSGNGLAEIKKAANGYCKFANGLIIQWGRTNNRNALVTVTLNTPFSSASSYVPVVIDSTSSNGQSHPGIISTSTNSFVFRHSTDSSQEYWIAIGY